MKIRLVDMVRKGEFYLDLPESGVLLLGRSPYVDVPIQAQYPEGQNLYHSRNPNESFLELDGEGLEYLGCISRIHARLFLDPNNPPMVADGCFRTREGLPVHCPSHNGTFINGERVDSSNGMVLNPGDILGLGPYEFRVEYDLTSRVVFYDDPVGTVDYVPGTIPFTPERQIPETVDYVPEKKG